ncbi:MAG: hypothetical protein KC776_04740 [Myxococcales bacterium]|nr:hypothetical protein [Myxococcales bacterium]MCB9579063.1 hypothetical protein [Polyangiaceae bacterium]
MSEARAATLVVIEYGASWPKWLAPNHYGHLAVVAQHYEGEPSSLVAQVANRVARLEGTGWKLDTMVLAVNGRTDDGAFAARSVLSRGLLARLQKSGGGDLVLTVDDGVGPRACQELTGLAAALDGDAVGWAVGVSVRIGRQEPIQGLSSDWSLLHSCAPGA